MGRYVGRVELDRVISLVNGLDIWIDISLVHKAKTYID